MQRQQEPLAALLLLCAYAIRHDELASPFESPVVASNMLDRETNLLRQMGDGLSLYSEQMVL
jgi:hypothetical protein